MLWSSKLCTSSSSSMVSTCWSAGSRLGSKDTKALLADGLWHRTNKSTSAWHWGRIQRLSDRKTWEELRGAHLSHATCSLASHFGLQTLPGSRMDWRSSYVTGDFWATQVPASRDYCVSLRGLVPPVRRSSFTTTSGTRVQA